MADYSIKQGDTLPVFTDTLTYSDGTAVNLTGATVKFVMRAMTAATPAVNAAATIVNAVNGQVSYTPTGTDTATAGQYVAVWVVTFSGGQTQNFPTVGALDVNVEENLTTAGGARLVGLADVKNHLNIPANDRSHDAELLGFIDSAQPVIRNIVGDVLSATYTEWYEGGGPTIQLRHPPVLSVASVTEYRGNVAYPLTQVSSPSGATAMSCIVEPDGRITRVNGATAEAVIFLSSQGLFATFPVGPDAVQVVYTAGRATVPGNVRLAMLELVRVNYQVSQQAGRRPFGGTGTGDDTPTPGVPMGFFVPNRVRELLEPDRRPPTVA